MFKRMLFSTMILLLAGSVAGYAAANGRGDEPVKPPKMEQLQPVPIVPLRPLQSLSGGFPRVDAVIYSNYITASYLNIFEMIVGRVPGVWVTGGPNFYRVRIRNAQGPPLIVIDEMPFYNNSDREVNNLIQIIPPQDVDYIEVIKNFSGASRYGLNAGNGVIVIRTKRGGSE